MRKLLTLAFSGLMLMGLAACGDENAGDNANSNPDMTAPAEPGMAPADPGGGATTPPSPGEGTNQGSGSGQF
ncbi:DcrB/PsbP domain-containing protein [Martelella soudanensis]|uniref:hypothetical protein n=1 Tax=unclassified Martelella TaxID=2629616 RepID=UPI0015DE9915|nr:MULTISPECIES: hypothetical protein [unclassified Martelella]